jgi:hypothetical protein
MNYPESDTLLQFFGAYFNQDWSMDDPTPEAVVGRFLRENSLTDVNKVAAELRQLLESPLSDEELKNVVCDKFLCYYVPPSEISMRNWLTKIQLLLTKN